MGRAATDPPPDVKPDDPTPPDTPRETPSGSDATVEMPAADEPDPKPDKQPG
jgi:hypothetical protein